MVFLRYDGRMPRAFIIHGYGGVPTDGWQPWLKRELENRGYEVFVPAMPDTQHPRVGPWVKMLSETVGEPRQDDLFVGHSLGCITIVRYLQTLRPGERVTRAIFVAGFYEELGPEYDELKSFLDDPVDWGAVKAACASFVVIHSEDDDAVPSARALALAEKLGVQVDMRQGYGHFSGSEGHRELPLILEKL